ncbi:hypothetical protein MIV083L [Invertebrate iridescent virus 3]|uniref:Uncharacterized protein 083L n=1 Tax=Invertebrate iridescent virus 3 TaxID=345201 RepID=VF358_IIV3|nr:hypothetical protein MIV083L [Invertebrate iridescent virus 3]Q196X7.1 RecName: Full=Uncharacterized protein 083L [Invertebrate iridescent virus 3]ABF82113.1 hypothetical protein MIV083L [Invertebrate iridescent virus 3]
MDYALEQAIKTNLVLLVEFILEKHPTIERHTVYQKVEQLTSIQLGKVSSAKQSSKSTTTTTPKTGGRKKIRDAIERKKATIIVRKSQWSNYVLTVPDECHNDENLTDLIESNFVMDVTTKTIVATETKDGALRPLNRETIDICNKHKLRYEVPLNLNLYDNEDSTDAALVTEMEELGLTYASSDDEEEKNQN